MKKYTVLFAIGLAPILMANDASCSRPSSDSIQREQQEVLLKEGTSAIGMPSIRNFRERRLLKDILELRDQDGLLTYTYLYSDYQGKWIFLCDSVGYPLPYSTQFTNPSKVAYADWRDSPVLPQADPNGLFSPSSASGTWVMCNDAATKKARVVYVEPNVLTSPFKLP